MKLDIKPVLRGGADSLGFDFEYSPDPDSFYPDVTFPGSVRVGGSVTARAVSARADAGSPAATAGLRLRAEFDYSAPCARCLEPARGKIVLDYEAEAGADEDIEPLFPGEYVFAPGGLLDLAEVVREQILLAIPAKILCREDCPGLCPVCGKSLEIGCGCRRGGIDPRLEVLRGLLDDIVD